MLARGIGAWGLGLRRRKPLKRRTWLKRGRPPVRRTPLNKLGRIGRGNIAFTQVALEFWFTRGEREARPADCGPDDSARTIYEVMVQAVDGPSGQVQRATIERHYLNAPAAGFHYKGRNVQVGHKVGMGRDRRADLRWSLDAVEPQTIRYNAWLETVSPEAVLSGQAVPPWIREQR